MNLIYEMEIVRINFDRKCSAKQVFSGGYLSHSLQDSRLSMIRLRSLLLPFNS